MDLQRFLDTLDRLTETQVRALGSRLDHHHGSAADEVEEWHLLLGVRRALQRAHRSRDAAMAAHEASARVVAAAAANGIPLPDPDVTCVARAAAEVARAIAAGEDASGELHSLLAEWIPIEVLVAA